MRPRRPSALSTGPYAPVDCVGRWWSLNCTNGEDDPFRVLHAHVSPEIGRSLGADVPIGRGRRKILPGPRSRLRTPRSAGARVSRSTVCVVGFRKEAQRGTASPRRAAVPPEERSACDTHTHT